MIEVVRPGPLSMVQDLGRPGWAHLGVPGSGAADRPSLRLANRLVGNAEGLPALETTVSGPTLRFDGDCLVAVTGADAPVRIGDRDCPLNERIHVHAGETLAVGAARAGLRTYVAFAGGVCAPRVLGSSAHDTLTKLGPPPLKKGDHLRIGEPPPLPTSEEIAPAAPPMGELGLPLLLGPRDDLFPASTLALLRSGPFEVGPDSNRIGLRLSGPPLNRTGDEELLSEALLPGALQVPPSGNPILMLVDHPTTGGYPVIGIIRSEHLKTAAQLRPGQHIYFIPHIAATG
jgi:biotin-dependent carboxylase-like uncharacterized protein